LLAILAMSATLALGGCAAPVRPYRCSIDPAKAEVDVHAVWSCNRDVLGRAARGKRFSIRELVLAAEFFEQLTGLRVDTQPISIGVLPGGDLGRSLEDLDAWYKLHRSRLTWDAGTGTVVLTELAVEGGAS
jgi:hypothetical protein